MTNDGVLCAHRRRVLAGPRELDSVAAACRLHGIHRSTFSRWKNAVVRFEASVLRRRGDAASRICPTQSRVLVEHRSIAFALGHPGYGPAHLTSDLAHEKRSGQRDPATGACRVLRHGIGTRAARHAQLTGCATPLEPAREPWRHISAAGKPGRALAATLRGSELADAGLRRACPSAVEPRTRA
jgi:hypothetical protein